MTLDLSRYARELTDGGVLVAVAVVWACVWLVRWFISSWREGLRKAREAEVAATEPDPDWGVASSQSIVPLSFSLDTSSIWSTLHCETPSTAVHVESTLTTLLQQEFTKHGAGLWSKSWKKPWEVEGSDVAILTGVVPWLLPEAVKGPWPLGEVPGGVTQLSEALRRLEALGWRSYQLDAIRAAAGAPLGRCVLELGTGAGKTRVALGLAYALRGRWAYVVYGKDLVAQTAADVAQWRTQGLAVDLHPMGWRALAKRAEEHWTGVIVDECHQVAAPSYAEALEKFKGEWRIGMSGTPGDRPDGKTAFVYGLLGPSVYAITVEELTRMGFLAEGKVFLR